MENVGSLGGREELEGFQKQPSLIIAFLECWKEGQVSSVTQFKVYRKNSDHH